MFSLKKLISKIIGWYGFKLLSKNHIKNLRIISKNTQLNTSNILDKIFSKTIYSSAIFMNYGETVDICSFR